MKFVIATAAAFVMVIFLGNFVFLLNNDAFHKSKFEELGVDGTIAANVVNYVNGKTGLRQEFNAAEATHLKDVKNVFGTIWLAYYSSLILLALLITYLLVTDRFKQIIPASMALSGVISLLLLLLIFLFSLNFTGFFSAIHKPFFAPDTWLFPEDSLLVAAFPEKIFQSFAANLFRLIFISSAVFFGAGLYIRKKFKQQITKSHDASQKL